MSKKMKVLAVCGMGIGTSVLLKIQIDKVLKELDIDADIELSDISTARGLAMSADLIVAASELADRIGEVNAPIVPVKNFMDLKALKEGISAALNLNE